LPCLGGAFFKQEIDMTDEFLNYRELFKVFDAYTCPKLMRVMDAQGIPYIMDNKGKPTTTQSAIDTANASKKAALLEAAAKPPAEAAGSLETS